MRPLSVAKIVTETKCFFRKPCGYPMVYVIPNDCRACRWHWCEKYFVRARSGKKLDMAPCAVDRMTELLMVALFSVEIRQSFHLTGINCGMMHEFA